MAAAAFILLHLGLITLAAFLARPDLNFRDRNPAQRQYEDWAIALEEGHLWLSEPVPESLLAMDNPYDYIARVIRGNESGDYYPGDVALYDGHYFVYFGCAPEYLFFYPFRRITGHTLPTWLAVLGCGLLAVPGAFLLARGLVRWLGNNPPAYPRQDRLSLTMLFAAVFIAGSGLPYLVSLGGTYSMPSVLGLAATFWGLAGWLGAAERMRGGQRGRSEDWMRGGQQDTMAAAGGTHRDAVLSGRMNRTAGTAVLLAFSSLLLALNIGCRPQCALVCLLAFPIFREEIRDGRFFRFSREALVNTLCVVLPFAVVGVLVLHLNAMRFGSPFEFGFHYLLTTADMLHHKTTARQIAVGAWMELLKPLNLDLRFPFLHGVEWNEALTEGIYIEPMLGGFFALAPFALLGFIPWRIASTAATSGSARNAWALTGTSLFIGAVIALADVASAGISQRYESDFAVFFLLAAVLVFRQLHTEGMHKVLRAIGLVLAVITIAAAYLLLLSDGRYFSMKDYNPGAYEALLRVFGQ